MSWLTKSKALLRSKKTIPASSLLSMAFNQLSEILSGAVSRLFGVRSCKLADAMCLFSGFGKYR